MILSLCIHNWIFKISCDIWGMEPQMWHFGLGAVSSVAGWIWHSGINARRHGSIYHSQHQWCCWISNGHVAWTILYRFCSSKRSCCIYQSYYIWHCYTSYSHKYKRYVIQSLTQYQKKQCTKKTTIWIFTAVKSSELLNYLYDAFSIYQEIFLKNCFIIVFSGVKFGSKMISANFWTCICSDSWAWEATLQSTYL